MKTNEKKQKKKENDYPKSPDFSDLTPDMQIGEPSENRLFERAFHRHEDLGEDEYAQNTATWD